MSEEQRKFRDWAEGDVCTEVLRQKELGVFKEQLPPKKVERFEVKDESGEVENETYISASLPMTLQSPELTSLLGYF